MAREIKRKSHGAINSGVDEPRALSGSGGKLIVDATKISADGVGSALVIRQPILVITPRVDGMQVRTLINFATRLWYSGDKLQSATATTAVLPEDGYATENDYYNTDCWLYIKAGTGAGQVRQISDYVGSTRTATVSSWSTTPDETSEFELIHGEDLVDEYNIASRDLQVGGNDYISAKRKPIYLAELIVGSAGGQAHVYFS